RCLVFCSPSSPRQFFVADRINHEHNTNHLRLGDFTVRFRFGRTGRDPPETQLRLELVSDRMRVMRARKGTEGGAERARERTAFGALRTADKHTCDKN